MLRYRECALRAFIIFACANFTAFVPAHCVGVAGIALSAWSRDWQGLAVSALVSDLGMVGADGGRYLTQCATRRL